MLPTSSALNLSTRGLLRGEALLRDTEGHLSVFQHHYVAVNVLVVLT
jgi:hypothetical protein